MTHSTTQTIIWLSMRLEAPASWEIVRYALHARAGSLALIDRRHQRLSLSWRQLARQPDLAHMLADYQSRDRLHHPESRFRPLSPVNGWVGVLRRAGQATLSRALRYEPALRRLIELVLPWPTGRDAQLERRILESFLVLEDTGQGPPNRWCAFGLDVSAPPAWELAEASVQAGKAELTFAFEHSRAAVRRLGAAPDWFDGQVDDFLRRDLDDPRAEVRSTQHHGHRAAAGLGLERGPRWRRLLGRLQHRQDLVWHCPADHALYQVTTLGPRDEPVGPEAFGVRCCPAGGRERT